MSNITLHALTPAYIHEYNGGKAIIVASIFIPLEVAFVCLRSYSRSLKRAENGIDDVLIWASLVVCIISDVYCIALVKFAGAGRHLRALQYLGHEETVELWAEILLGAEWLYFLSVSLPKLCILTLYLQIFAAESLRASCYSVGTIIVCAFLVNGLTVTLACPLLAYFDAIVAGHCNVNLGIFARWISLPNIITDVIMLVIPLPTILHLHLPRAQKLGLSFTFCMGSIGLVASCMRFSSFLTDAMMDPTFASPNLMIWTIIEPGMYLIAACLLRLRPLLQLFVKNAWFRAMTRKQALSRQNIWRPQPAGPPIGMAKRCAGVSRALDVSYGDGEDPRPNQIYDENSGSCSTFVGSERTAGAKDKATVVVRDGGLVTRAVTN